MMDALVPLLIDIRALLPTLADGGGGRSRGPYERAAVKRGAVVHFDNGDTPVNWPRITANPVGHFIDMAGWHLDRNWGTQADPVYGSGIMYHVGINPDGKAYWLRDFERVLWHCGEGRRNAEAVAIHCCLGGAQRATPEMLRTLTALCDLIVQASGGSRALVVGHREVSATPCPGTLMQDFVLPYRATEARPPTPDEAVDRALEAAWQMQKARAGAKVRKLYLATPYYTGFALRCELAVLTPDGRNLLAYLIDDGLTLRRQVGQAVEF